MRMRWDGPLPALLLSCALGACGTKLLPVSGTIAVSPSSLEFAGGTAGLQEQLSVSVSNSGDAPLTIASLRVASDPQHELAIADALTAGCDGEGRSGGFVLSPGECARFTVIWTPAAAHQAMGAIELDSSDADHPQITLPVSGTASSRLLQLCVLEADGGAGAADCSSLPRVPAVDFGDGQVGEPVSRTVRLTNQGTAALGLSPAPHLAAEEGTPEGFALSGQVPESLAPGASAELSITATPANHGTLRAALRVDSDDPRAPEVSLPLQIFVPGAQLCVDPPEGLDFGAVTLGQQETRELRFSNCGTTALTTNQFELQPAAPTTGQFASASGTLPTGSSTLAPGSAITLQLVYAPTAVQSDSAAIALSLLDGPSPVPVSVPLRGQGAGGACGSAGTPSPRPSIAASSSASEAGPYAPFSPASTPVAPLDWVKLNAADSVSNGSPVYTWQLVSQPDGASSSFDGAGSSAGGVQALFQPRVSGDYLISLQLDDAAGCVASETITVHVQPRGEVHLELTWAEPCGDVDLHYVPPGHAVCDGDDCAWYDGDAASGQPPTSWGATLDIDDRWGDGPENVTQPAPADGTYQAWAHYYSALPPGGGGGEGCGAVHPTLHVYLHGALAGTFSLPAGLTAGGPESPANQAWHAADVTVANGGTSLSVAAASAAPEVVSSCNSR